MNTQEGGGIIFEFDGNGDIDEFDEEMAEYELQLMEDEMIFEEMEKRIPEIRE